MTDSRKTPLLQMQQRRAIVSGATRGIGRAIALRLARDGYSVVAIGRSLHELESLSLEAKEGAIVPIGADLTKLNDIPDLVNRAANILGSIDLLVNCAGNAIIGGLFACAHRDFLEGFQLKFFAVVELTRAVWPFLMASTAGHLINIGGGAAHRPSEKHVVGGAINSALENFSLAMASQGCRDRVRVNIVHPALIETQRLAAQIDRVVEEQTVPPKQARAQMLARRYATRFGRPDEVANVVAFLDSSAGSGFQGAVVPVDGGSR